MLGSKRINIARFEYKGKEAGETDHQNSVTFFSKPAKPDKWYRKTYTHHWTSFGYEKEATSGDLFRFILGKDRAAKSQVTYDEENNLSLMSQHNPAGFESSKSKVESQFDNPRKLTSKVLNNFFNNLHSVEHGRAELEMAEIILQEIDGLSNNYANVGLNNKSELSRIDYDLTLFYQRYDEASIKNVFLKNERAVNATGNQKIIERFYKAQLKTVLLNKKLLTAICDRHFADFSEEKYPLNAVLQNTQCLKQYLLQSESFILFLQSFNCTPFIEECCDFFKHEEKCFPFFFTECIEEIENTLKEMAESCANNKSALRK